MTRFHTFMALIVIQIMATCNFWSGLLSRHGALSDAAPASYAAASDMMKEKVRGYMKSYSFYVTPLYGQCPKTKNLTTYDDEYEFGSIRRLNSRHIVKEEQVYLKEHTDALHPLWWKYVEHHYPKLSQAKISQIVNYYSHSNIALAHSGGGWRALLFGAGVTNGLGLPMFDKKLERSIFDDGVSALSPDRINYLLNPTDGFFSKIMRWLGSDKPSKDAAVKMSPVNRASEVTEFNLLSHIAGVSGGSWLTASLAVTGFPSLSHMINKVWVPWDLPPILNQVTNIDAKATNGFVVGYPDQWANYLATKLGIYNNPHTWHEVLSHSDFINFKSPIPLITMSETFDSNKYYSLSPVWESTPFATGSFSPYRRGFILTKYLGTVFNSSGLPVDISEKSTSFWAKSFSYMANTLSQFGKINYILNKIRLRNEENLCVQHYDSVSYLSATSSGLFTAALRMLKESPFKLIIAEWFSKDDSISSSIPNFFYGVNQTIANDKKYVKLIDGGLTGQNIPIMPLLEPSRKIELIYAMDSSADIDFYPTGQSLLTIRDYARTLGYPFPPIPKDINSMIKKKIGKSVRIFGCGNLIGKNYNGPIITYIPNHDYLHQTNVSTSRTTFTSLEVAQIIENGRAITINMGSKNNTSPETNVDRSCLPCVNLIGYARSIGPYRTRQTLGAKCMSCYSKLCYVGGKDDVVPIKPFFSDPLKSEEIPLVIP